MAGNVLRGTLTAIVILMASLGARAADPTKVTLVQSSLSFNFVPLYIAQTEGYFTTEGLAVEVVLAGGGPKAMTALLGGGRPVQCLGAAGRRHGASPGSG